MSIDRLADLRALFARWWPDAEPANLQYPDNPTCVLKDREWQVVVGILNGMSIPQIAAQAGIGRHIMHDHLAKAVARHTPNRPDRLVLLFLQEYGLQGVHERNLKALHLQHETMKTRSAQSFRHTLGAVGSEAHWETPLSSLEHLIHYSQSVISLHLGTVRRTLGIDTRADHALRVFCIGAAMYERHSLRNRPHAPRLFVPPR